MLMMTDRFSFLLAAICAFLIVAVPGCGGVKLHEVSGKVTIDGEVPPIPLEIRFEPVDHKGNTIGAGTSIVQKNSGTYQIFYPGGQPGLPAGEYTVLIDVVPDDETSDGQTPVSIPAKYNSRTELKAAIQPGKNENVDFDISLRR